VDFDLDKLEIIIVVNSKSECLISRIRDRVHGIITTCATYLLDGWPVR